MYINTVGSICSGIEAASVAWGDLGLSFQWFSEIADFPSRLLQEKYPQIPNLGDMNNIPEKLHNGLVVAPDLICGGTPCQAFSLAGWKKGLDDDRGNLSLKFVDIIEANDYQRSLLNKNNSVVFWENVEGVLTDKTNAFGCFVSLLAGLSDEIVMKRWPNAGLIRGPKRNVAWRVLDAKFFGVPQQRRRLYLIAGGKNFNPENILFERHTNVLEEYPKQPLVFNKDGSTFEIFREYTDCLYSAYGTKWNGNAAAYNGSLYVVQDEKIRRLSALECERLMGFPDNYTNIKQAKKTNRYQAVGNSWVIPVIRWLGKRMLSYGQNLIDANLNSSKMIVKEKYKGGIFFNFGNDLIAVSNDLTLNCSPKPEQCSFGNLKNVLCKDVTDDIYISPVGCYGIYRRKQERGLKINPRLEQVLLKTSQQMSFDEIEKRSLVQKRGEYSQKDTDFNCQLSLFAS